MSEKHTDRFEAARAVADAVVYEGYVLYPYRASATKNRSRWQFGVLTPRTFSEADGYERWKIHNECLIQADRQPELAVRIRFLQLQRRLVEAASSAGLERVSSLEVDGRRYSEWDETIEHVIDLQPKGLTGQVSWDEGFYAPAGEEIEDIRSASGSLAGRVLRRRQRINGRAHLQVRPLEANGSTLFKVELDIENVTECDDPEIRRDDVLGQSLLALHSMLAATHARFVSLLDPPEGLGAVVGSLTNDGAFPVLVGDADDVVLCSPIILYDHPQVAPESPGDLYDSTEIDELLALRVLTLTEGEKAEARATDPRAAAVVDRCEELSPEVFERLHGAVRELRPVEQSLGQHLMASVEGPGTHLIEAARPKELPWWDPISDTSVDPNSDTIWVGDHLVQKGSKVRLAPSRRADAQDLFVAGKIATVAGVFKDVDGSIYLAVSVDDDPASTELIWQGRYLFFHPDEVVPFSSLDKHE